MKLVCVRHGQTEWTVTGRYSGTSDPALDEFGRAQARQTGRWLNNLDQKFDRFLTSPLARCRETAELIAVQVPALPAMEIADDLIEIHYGDWEGRTRDEIRADYPDAFASWDRDPTAAPPPNGESVTSVSTRVARQVNRLIEADVQSALIVAHRTVLRILVAQALGMNLSQYRRRLDHGPAAVSILDLRSVDDGQLLLANYDPQQA